MKLHRLKPASDHDIRKWLEEELQLSPYQKSRLRGSDMIRSSPFYFYEPRRNERVSALWRFTIIPYLIYWVILFCGLPFTFLVRGDWGYGRKFYDNFHARWTEKLNL